MHSKNVHNYVNTHAAIQSLETLIIKLHVNLSTECSKYTSQ